MRRRDVVGATTHDDCQKQAVTDDGGLLPRHLVAYRGQSADAYREHWQARNAWLREQGIDGTDWMTVHRLIEASREAHGVPPSAAYTRALAAFAEQVLSNV